MCTSGGPYVAPDEVSPPHAGIRRLLSRVRDKPHREGQAIVKRLVLAIGIAAFVLGGPIAHASVDPGDLCKEKKDKAAGKKAFDILKAFGKNTKVPNDPKLAQDISKAQSKFTKGFQKADAAGPCPYPGDEAVVEPVVDDSVADVISTIENGPVACSPACCYVEIMPLAPDVSCVEYTGTAAQIATFMGTCAGGTSLPAGFAWHSAMPGPCAAGPMNGFPCNAAMPNWIQAPKDSSCP